jgi:ABC-type transport system involved in Fe-S cluster assembly fused permease/ATPase subunit
MSDSGASAADLYVTISALDTSTERDIQKALQNLVRGRSSLSIAHRLSVSLFLCLEHGV